MKVLVVDNYDSFTFNLYQYVGEILIANGYANPDVDVVRNDELSIEEIASRKYDRILISPGPGSSDDPAYFGVCADVIRRLGRSVPVLGICLGMQGIAHVYGGKVVQADRPMHGKTSRVSHDGQGVFQDLPQDLEVMRYHSLVVRGLPPELVVTATADDGDIMGLRHAEYPIEGVQFHPESFATEGGKQIIKNFLMGGEL